ncbi:pyridoxamine 5'-phosphate oxidase family protein [Parafrigoribacterium mesophilum]|uniref:pyridoxamine 5'-phosphate oxidase family protein n=1 Tax=Parafrigoribacterium mesophilum TaxID=433646 RepID=UPI0031FC8FA9
MLNDDPITVLDRDGAWKFLQTGTMGRLAVSVGGRPGIFPVNYHADDTSVLFRTAPGSKLLEVTINATVAFETDRYDTDEGWSVVVTGTASVLDKQAEIFAAEALPLHSWVPTLKPVFVRITPIEVSGRQFRFGPEPDPESY